VLPARSRYSSRLAYDELYFGQPADEYSVGLYMAVSCLDYPQLFPMKPAPAKRLADLKAAEKALPAGTFAPFSTAQWLAMDQNTETGCRPGRGAGVRDAVRRRGGSMPAPEGVSF
jgi:hypothetical protein